MASGSKSTHCDRLRAAWGGLPPQIRTLYIANQPGSGDQLAQALAVDSASQVLVEEAVGAAAGLSALGERIYDAILITHLPGELDAFEFVEGLRAGGAEEPILILGADTEAELATFAFEVGADAYLCLQTATTRTFLWTLARAVERHQLIAENRRLAQVERNRSQQEQSEVERLLAGQRQLIEHCRSTAENTEAYRSSPRAVGSSLPPALRDHYRELLRAHVIMGSGNLSREMAALAAALAESDVASNEVLALHVEVVEELARGLGSRSARHVMTRADLLIMELLAQLSECHRQNPKRSTRATNA